jgi:hypothetical protein
MFTAILSRLLKLFTPLQWIEFIIVIAVAITFANLGGTIITYVETKLGMETKANLKEETIVQKDTIKDLSIANKDLVTTIATKDKSNKIDTEAVANKFKGELKIDSNFQSIKDQKVKDIQDIKDSFATKPITIENTQEETRQISLKQINSLWDLYCTGAESCDRITKS